MTSWRDARLHRALEDAPDRDAVPAEATRQSVHDFAHRAVQRPAPVAVPWWKKIWPDTGAARMPWNAALATVALATLVTVLWHDEPVPGAKTESQADRPAPVAVKMPAPVPATPPAAKAPAEVQAPAPATAPAAKAKPAPDRAVAQRPPAIDAARDRRNADTIDALRDRQEQPLAKTAPAPESRAKSAESTAGFAAGASTGPPRKDSTQAAEMAPAPAAPAAPPPPAAAAAPAPRAAMRAAPALASESASVARPDWTHVRIESGGRSIDLPREQATTLVNLLLAVERAARVEGPLDTPATTRIELRSPGTTLELIELADGRVRWQSLRGVTSEAVAARPSRSQVQALQAEVDRLLAR